MSKTLIRQVRVGPELYTLEIDGGTIVRIDRGDRFPREDEDGWDAEGLLYMPVLADMHCHLDKHFIGERWRSRRTIDSLPNQLQREKELLASLTGSVEERARILLDLMLSHGTTRIRTHVDVDPDIGLKHLDAVLKVREQYRGLMEIEIVAFPQQGLLRSRSYGVMREAMQSGADVVGAVDPGGLDRGIEPCLEQVFGLATEYNAGVDIHLHDPGHLGVYTMERMAEYTEQSGLQGRVAVSHAWGLGQISESESSDIGHKLREQGVSVITSVPIDRQMMNVPQLDSIGVDIRVGTDNVLDAWSPFGSGDMLERLGRLAERCYWVEDEQLLGAYRFGTDKPLTPKGGDAADFVLVNAMNLEHAMASAPVREWVVVNGKPVAGRRFEGGGRR
ncbi:amidohydrolase family protein [Cohnella herbarum]|uniref:Amidohydrolase family protein n=1 Tax=Cohnella herbarum TaxID=2728023 RepID=A0A7Z2ZP96_9BACL|nr:amidohydrolase family protein [Cohnella herbarum]QJD86660.1 amidohydrolase family protein [Cohnella herbarum]